MNFVCVQCGRRQPAAAKCSKCGDDNLLDLDKEQTRDLLLDIDLRLKQKRETIIRLGACVIGIGFVVLMWTLPGYWALRARSFALPFFIDQVAFMVIVAMIAMKLLGMKLDVKPKFPFMDPTTGRVRD